MKSSYLLNITSDMGRGLEILHTSYPSITHGLLKLIWLVLVEYSQQDVTFLNLFISVRCSTCFRRVFPYIIRSSKLYIQRQVLVRQILLLLLLAWLGCSIPARLAAVVVLCEYISDARTYEC